MYLSIRVITLQNLELPFYCMCMSLNAYLFFLFWHRCNICCILWYSAYWLLLLSRSWKPLVDCKYEEWPSNHFFGIFFICTLLIYEPLAYHPLRFSLRLNQIHWFFKHIFLKCQISHEGNTFCCVSSNISYSAQYFFPTRIWPWIRVLFLPWIWASSIFFPRMTCNDSLLFQQFYKSRWTCLSLTFLFSVNVLLPLYI